MCAVRIDACQTGTLCGIVRWAVPSDMAALGRALYWGFPVLWPPWREHFVVCYAMLYTCTHVLSAGKLASWSEEHADIPKPKVLYTIPTGANPSGGVYACCTILHYTAPYCTIVAATYQTDGQCIDNKGCGGARPSVWYILALCLYANLTLKDAVIVGLHVGCAGLV